MANWHYINKNGEKITVTSKELKQLALQGTITPETIVDSEDGKTVPARKVKGLIFAEAAQPEMIPSVETYSLAGDSLAENNVQKFSENYFYTDENGIKSGQINKQRLQTLIDRGTFTSSTQLETDTGVQITAGQIPGLDFFQNAILPSFTPTISDSDKTPLKNSSVPPSFWNWVLLDYRFRFFLTPILLKIMWCMWVVVVELSLVLLVIGICFAILSSILPSSSSEISDAHFGASSVHGSGSSMGVLMTRVLPIIFIPIIAATFLLCIRIAFECVMIIFRIGEHLKNIDEKT